jgi:hypothetical protein
MILKFEVTLLPEKILVLMNFGTKEDGIFKDNVYIHLASATIYKDGSPDKIVVSHVEAGHAAAIGSITARSGLPIYHRAREELAEKVARYVYNVRTKLYKIPSLQDIYDYLKQLEKSQNGFLTNNFSAKTKSFDDWKDFDYDKFCRANHAIPV